MPESGEVDIRKWDVSTVNKVTTLRKTITLSAPGDEYYFSGSLSLNPNEVSSYEIKINGARFGYGVANYQIAGGGCMGTFSTVHYWSKKEGSTVWGIILNPGSTVYIEYIVTIKDSNKSGVGGKGNSVSFVSKRLYEKNAPLVQTTPATPTIFDNEAIPRY